MKQSALDEIDLPIEVKSGFLGELHISVSWKALSSQPVVVKISDIFLLAGPTSRNLEEEQEMRKKRERAFRAKRLQFAELTGEDPLEDPAKKDQQKDTDTFTERAIKKNCQQSSSPSRSHSHKVRGQRYFVVKNGLGPWGHHPGISR